MTNFDITKLKKAKKYKIEYIDVEAIVNNEYLWNFRMSGIRKRSYKFFERKKKQRYQ